MTYRLPVIATLGVLLLGAAFLAVTYSIRPAYGSTIEGQEYYATTTAPNAVYGATISASILLKSSAGSLSSVVITGANTGVINFYNATTTDVNKRLGNRATSSILIASFPASTVAGTYTFDARFTDGLFLDLVSGSIATSTITYR